MKRYTKEFITAERRQLLEVWKQGGDAQEWGRKAGKLQTIFESCARGLITDFEAVRLTVETVEG